MKSTIALSLAATAWIAFAQPVLSDDFTLDFEWGDIPRCTSGSPNRVDNPVFTLNNVPTGTARIDFNMRDLQAPSYYHGGGKIAYTGQTMIEPGAFKYASPCPPGSRHQYRWTARAKDDNGKTLGKATAKRWYP